MPIITQLYRYPVKGLSAESLQQVTLERGKTIPLDRRFAIAQGDTVFDVDNPVYLPKTHFLMLMKNEKLAALHSHYDDNTGILSIYADADFEHLLVCGLVDKADGKARIEAFLAEYLGAEVRGKPRFLEASGHSFSDVPQKVVSFINLATVRELEAVMGVAVNPLRFRGNVYFEGAPAWAESAWVGQTFSLGTAQLRVVKLTERCVATNVNPITAERDMKIPLALVKRYQHCHLGFYAEVVSGGVVLVGDAFGVTVSGG